MPGRFPARDIPGGEALRLLGPGLGAVALGLLVRPVEIAGIVLRIPGALLAVLGLMALLLGLSRLAYLRIGAARLRGHVLGALAWRGAETILDIGRPEGAMAAEAAPLLRSGRALVRPPAEIDLPDASVDAVFALDALGPLGPAARRLAAREIARVLRPGAPAFVAGQWGAADILKALEGAGLVVEGPRSVAGLALTLMWLAAARRPEGAEA